ncbi:MAG: hypothetical protein ACKO5K_09270, partial [Armatimonadota bacterium]
LVLVRAADGTWPITRIFPRDTRPYDPKRPPFRTRIEVADGTLVLRDFAAGTSSRRSLEENSFRIGEGWIDLAGWRMVRFRAAGTAKTGTTTMRRLGGTLEIDGYIARGKPDARPDGPRAGLGTYGLAVHGSRLDLAYAVGYLPFPLPVAPTRGSGDLRLHAFGNANAPPILHVSAAFREADFPINVLDTLNVTRASGTVDWAAGVLRVRTSGRIEGIPAELDATVSGLATAGGAYVRARGRVPAGVPVATLAALVPGVRPPRALQLPERVRVDECVVEGPLRSVRARAVVSGDTIGWSGMPRVGRWRVPVSVGPDGIVAGPIAASVAGGGTLEGRLRWAPTTGVGNADLAVHRIPLAGFAAIRGFDARWRPGGRFDGEARLAFRTGLRRGIPVSGRIDGVVVEPALGQTTFERAVLSADLAGSRIAVRRARLTGSAGVVDVGGTIDPGKGLRLDARLVGIDIATVSAGLGGPEAEGVLSARALLSGSFTSPRVVVDDLSILGPRIAWQGRLLAADAVRADSVRATLGPEGSWNISWDQPVRLSLYPAEVRILGSVASGPVSPRLDLRASASNIAVERVLPWISADQAGWSRPWLREDPVWRALAVDLEWIAQPPPISGRIVEAEVRATGTLEDPRVAGSVSARRLRLGDFPVESVTGDFAWEDGGWSVRRFAAKSAAGELAGEVSSGGDGALAGAVTLDQVRLEALAPWTGDKVSLGGALRLKGTVRGSRNAPSISGSVEVLDECSVAGLALGGARFGAWTVEGRLPEGADPSVAARIEGFDAVVAGAPLKIGPSALAWPSGKVAAKLEWEISLLRDLVRRIAETPAEDTVVGEWTRRIASGTPDDIDARATVVVGVSGAIGENSGDPLRIDATVRGDDARIGPVRFDSVDAVVRTSGRRVTIERLDLQGPAATVEGGGTIDLPSEAGGSIGFDLRLESLQPSLELVRALDPDFPLFGALDSVSIVAKGTSDAPKVQATLEGSGVVFKAPDRQPLTLDRLRVNARLFRDGDGDLVLGIDDGLATHGDEEVRWDFLLPVDLERRRIVAGRPIRRLEARVRGLRMATLLAFVDVPVDQVDGRLEGRLAIEGSLNTPSLGGNLTLDGGEATFRKVGSARRAPVNAISEMRVDVRFSGKNVVVEAARIGFGPPTGDNRRAGGVVSARGTVRLDNLEDFTRLFTGLDPAAEPPRLRGNYDLSVRVAALRPDVENLTGLFGMVDARGQKGLGEAGSGLVDGEVAITGPLLSPLVATPRDKPLRITELNLRLPRPGPLATSAKAPLLDPLWAVRMDIPSDARVVLVDSPVVRLEFNGRGSVGVSGSLSAPTFSAIMYPAGGYLRYPLARLDLQRGGTARIEYDARRLAVNLNGVSAEGKITGIAGASARRGDGGLVNVGLGGVGGGAETTYRILATFNGAIDLAGTSGTDLLQQTTLQAQPDLTRQQILELLGARRQFDLVASGDTEQAFREFGKRFADAGLVTGLFRPLVSGVRSAFGLDAFDMNYSLDGTAFFRVVRRLPTPVDRFTVEVSKSFTTRVSNTATLPFRFGLNYELFPLQPRGRFQPRLLLGVAATSEQRDTLSFVRGTVNY